LPARIEGALGRFLQDETGRRERAFAALKACDGLGARRIASALNGRRETKNGCEITLRSMTSDDGDWLLQLQRQPSTREFARNRAVPNPTEHVAWLRAKLNDPAVILNVIEVNENRVGFVRLEQRGVQSGGGFEVSVAIEPTSNGLGIGSGALALAHELVPAERLWAFVMPENVASQRLFHRAGYRSHREPNWWAAEPLVGKAPHN
ncbi:MAG: GNAT family N-acetyltransferase, partial [Pseudomonadota bacterium]